METGNRKYLIAQLSKWVGLGGGFFLGASVC